MGSPIQKKPRIAFYTFMLFAVWSTLICISGILNIRQGKMATVALATKEAHSNFNKDFSIRLWATRHGGIYVPENERTPSNPYLKHVEERDIITPSGKKLTLMNPAYMLRQIMEEYAKQFGIKGHITSLTPLRPQNGPDAWERKALKEFENGKKEVFEFVDINGEPYLRLIQAINVEKGCLKCHGYQGYKVGDIRGGIGVSVPMAPYLIHDNREVIRLAGTHVGVWFIGSISILFGGLLVSRYFNAREQAEKSLRENEKLLRIIAENYPNSYISIINRDFTVAFTSGLEFKRKHITPQDYLGQTPEQIFSDNAAIVKTHYEKTFRGEECAFELTMKKEHQYYRTVPLYDEKGTIPRILVVAENITLRKRLETRLHQTQKMDAIATLAGGIAHDFNNLLSVITGNISYTLSHLKREDEMFEVLSDVQKGAQQAQNLTQQLLTFSRGGDPVKKTADINEIIKESAQFAIRGSNVRCEYALYEKLAKCEVDSGQINQVISNLVINAYQSMPKGGILRIKTENLKIDADNGLPLPDGNYIKMTIQDQGVGISEKILANIFDPFFTTKQKGNGLGLSTVYAIIKKHDGHIAVYSEVGKGTVFHIYLPSSTNHLEESVEKPGSLHQGQGKILIMDDQEAILKMARRILDKMGYETVFAMEGSQAVLKYQEAKDSNKPFELVILDLTIPGGMGGLKTIVELLKIDPGVKAIVSSGYSNDPIMANYEDFGFCGVIPKPYTKEQLSETLDKIFGKSPWN